MIEQNDRLWSQLTKNKLFVRTTQLAQSRHVNIRWILNSHTEYSNQELARVDLQRRMGRNMMDFELVTHTSSHTTSEEGGLAQSHSKLEHITMQGRTYFGFYWNALRRGGLILTVISNTANWKLTPFTQNTLSRDQITELIQK